MARLWQRWLAMAVAVTLCGLHAAQDAAQDEPLPGQADREKLEVFRKSYNEARNIYYRRKTNLAAILLDVANKEGQVSTWTDMYKEAQMLSRQVLAIFPNDEAAQANLRGATNSLRMRTEQAGAQVVDDDEARARTLLDDDEEDDDSDEADQDGDSSDLSHASMSYAQAMNRAQQGKADQEVLAVFRNELAKAKDTANAEVIKVHKINLAALIIDIAKDEVEQSTWADMYAECIELSNEVIQIFPDDESAKANKQAAQAWLDHRKQQAKRAEAEFLSKMSEPIAQSPQGSAMTEEERARHLLYGDDDDDDDDTDDDEKDEL